MKSRVKSDQSRRVGTAGLFELATWLAYGLRHIQSTVISSNKEVIHILKCSNICKKSRLKLPRGTGAATKKTLTTEKEDSMKKRTIIPTSYVRSIYKRLSPVSYTALSNCTSHKIGIQTLLRYCLVVGGGAMKMTRRGK